MKSNLLLIFLATVLTQVFCQDEKPKVAHISIRHPKNCGPVCYMYCHFGNVLDERGCPTCRCRNPNGMRCPNNLKPLKQDGELARCSPYSGPRCPRDYHCIGATGEGPGMCCLHAQSTVEGQCPHVRRVLNPGHKLCKRRKMRKRMCNGNSDCHGDRICCPGRCGKICKKTRKYPNPSYVLRGPRI